MNKKNLSLYIHVPFCVKKCLYCDFLSGPSTNQKKEKYVNTLCEEITFWGKQVGDKYHIRSIFLGGGTPTCLSTEQLLKIHSALRSSFTLCDNCEFTTEANPGTVTPEHIQAWEKMGINRISLGMQSTVNEELKKLGRIHSDEEFLQTYRAIQKAGFSNINIDIMADIPGQTLESYKNTLQNVVQLQPAHISSYSLIIEPGTPFAKMEQEGTLKIADEDTDRNMYEYTKKFLDKNGYHRYEISNYARAGKECYHNSTYWEMKEYIGLGLGASSFFENFRFQNPEEFTEYQEHVQKMGQTSWLQSNLMQLEKATKKSLIEESLFLGLRMTKGVSRRWMEENFSFSFDKTYGRIVDRLFKEQVLAEDKIRDRIYLTDRGIDISNSVLSCFLLDEDQIK